MLTKTCTTLPGIGPNIAKKLNKCGINTLQDLIFHLPFRYQDRTRITPIRNLRPNDWCVISGTICKTEIKRGKRNILYCYVEDKTGILILRFFHFNPQILQRFNQSTIIRAFGEVRSIANTLEMVHPEYQFINEDENIIVEENLTPIYSTTQGLTQTNLRRLINRALTLCQQEISELEWMSNTQLEFCKLTALPDAIAQLHNPPADIPIQSLENGAHPALKRLAFDELIAQKLSMELARQERNTYTAHSLLPNIKLTTKFINLLPFKLTQAQQRVSEEICIDLQKTKPMLRLVQGDVGSGKTLVAALAALQSIANGFQVALMVPTDILSEQHTITMETWLTALDIKIQRLSGKMTAKPRREALAAILNHECQLIIGTHALFQDKVQFAKLGLIIIDEQHRFGVDQRISLQQKGQQAQSIPHQLLMTATPIPRTLAMTQFAHLDISIIDELPPGRTPITTALLNQNKRETIIQRVDSALACGRQAYWVCTLIDESDQLQCIAATETAQNLQAQLTNYRIGLIHGRMKAQEKEAIMLEFKTGKIHLLVATTVIEVGVDVPNASLMIIENAERLGLSQLHQLRGRVGRGSAASHCLLLYQDPLSFHGAERLKVMRNSIDGFFIAEKDLELRGSGKFLGTQQTGYYQYKIAQLQRDQALLPLLPPIVHKMLNETPDIAKNITKRWLGNYSQYLQG